MPHSCYMLLNGMALLCIQKTHRLSSACFIINAGVFSYKIGRIGHRRCRNVRVGFRIVASMYRSVVSLCQVSLSLDLLDFMCLEDDNA